MRPKVDAMLRERGFNTSQELEAKVSAILDGPNLRNYQALRNRFYPKYPPSNYANTHTNTGLTGGIQRSR